MAAGSFIGARAAQPNLTPQVIGGTLLLRLSEPQFILRRTLRELWNVREESHSVSSTKFQSRSEHFQCDQEPAQPASAGKTLMFQSAPPPSRSQYRGLWRGCILLDRPAGISLTLRTYSNLHCCGKPAGFSRARKLIYSCRTK